MSTSFPNGTENGYLDSVHIEGGQPIISSMTSSSAFLFTIQSRIRKQGILDPQKQRLYVEPATGGWMSKLQDEAKPLFIGFEDGSRTTLNRDERNILARWAVMFSLVVATFHPGLTKSSFEQRQNFRLTGQLPKGWGVWAARHRGDTEWTSFNHFGAHVPVREVWLRHPTITLMAQSTAVIIGRLYLQTAVFHEPRIAEAAGLKFVMPITSLTVPDESLADFRRQAINDEELDAFSRFLLKVPKERSRRNEGLP